MNKILKLILLTNIFFVAGLMAMKNGPKLTVRERRVERQFVLRGAMLENALEKTDDELHVLVGQYSHDECCRWGSAILGYCCLRADELVPENAMEIGLFGSSSAYDWMLRLGFYGVTFGVAQSYHHDALKKRDKIKKFIAYQKRLVTALDKIDKTNMV